MPATLCGLWVQWRTEARQGCPFNGRSRFTASVFIHLKGKPMTSLTSWRLSAGVLALVAAGAACADEPVSPKTREQGKAETREAIRTGEIGGGGEVNCKLNEANPSKYPAKPVPGGAKTREQVKAETREAMRSGEMSANGEAGCGPQMVKTPGSGKTRAQGKAETQLPGRSRSGNFARLRKARHSD